jgi:hypothetical protein
MSHVGKRYPNAQMNDICWDQLQGAQPPRKWWLETSSSSNGTLTIPWRSQRFISELPEHTIGTGVIEWAVNHPTVADNYILIRWTWFEGTTSSPTLGKMRTKIETEFWYQGVKMGDQTPYDDQGQQFFGATLQAFIFSSWLHLTNPVQFQTMTSARYGAGLWSDQPDYHPYRV